MAKCGQCAYYEGGGDWDICCDKDVRRLTYEDDDACAEFEQTHICRNVSRHVGRFFCSICGANRHELEVIDMECPKCHNAVTGALFGGSIGWRE